MPLFYTVSQKELLNVRNEIFFKSGIPALERNGFQKSPFSVHWFGRNNLKDFTYTLCRLTGESHLEIITTHISRGDSWIKIFLNVFKLLPALDSLDDLKNVDGLQYHLPPNSLTRMRLRSDDYKGIPLFNTIHHKVNSFYLKSDYHKRLNQLNELIENDMNNIDSFITRWHELHTPLIVDWEGKKLA